MRTIQRFTFCTVAAALLLVSGCQKQAGPGPAEQAGKAIDNAVTKVGQEIGKVGDSIKDAVKEDKKK
jgi:hypothetical protein